MTILDPILASAVAAIDAGDITTLDALIAQHPNLLVDRFPNGEQGYFADPYLFWFVAENPVRNSVLPPNIVGVIEAIATRLEAAAAPTRQLQLDYTLVLVATGMVPRQCGVQIPMIDALVALGAHPSGLDSVVAHSEDAAARRLLHHGATLTLAAATSLEMWEDARRLVAAAGEVARADALVTAAGRGHVDGVRFLLDAGADPNQRSATLHRHSTALHLAALAGKTDLCDLLLAAGARRDVKDDLWSGTPAGWAQHAGHDGLAKRLAP